MAEYGKLMDEGLALGILQNVNIAKDAMGTLGDAVSDVDMDAGYDQTMVDVLNTPDATVMGQTSETPRDLTVVLELDRMQLARAVYQLNNQETQRVGMRLAGGYA
jgi:hypothetical protein